MKMNGLTKMKDFPLNNMLLILCPREYRVYLLIFLKMEMALL